MNALELLFPEARDRVGHLRIRTTAPVAERLRRELRPTPMAVLHPAGLRPAAILCVRTIRTRSGAPQAPWSRVRAELESLVAVAGRPARGGLGACVPAVIFADAAELLACLAHDWTRGELHTHWWWQALFGRRPLEESARREWLAHPQLFPAALACLSTLDPGLRFLQRLTDGERQILWDRLLLTFALPRLHHAHAAAAGVPTREQPGRAATDMVAAAVAPWAQPLIRAPERSPSELRLIAVASLLHESPAFVCSAGFARMFHRWHAHRCGDYNGPGTGPAAEQPPDLAATRSLRDPEPARKSASTAGGPDPDAPVAVVPLRPEKLHLRPPAPLDRDTSRKAQRAAVPLARTAAAGNPAVISTHDAAVRDVIIEAAADRDAPMRAEPIETKWGGVFYLVNVALALELYGDFTSPARPGLALPVWDFLALFGRRFVGGDFSADQLDALLARLAGRTTSEPPARHFDPPEGQPLDEWLAETERRLRERLEAALGPQEPPKLLALVFAQRARVDAAATQVDVTFALGEHPIELRLAGLDRDPGWIPAAGRSLAFHYD